MPRSCGKRAPRQGTGLRLPGVVFTVAITSLVYLVFYFAYTNHISLFVANTGLGNASHSGMSYSIVNACGFVGGLFFGALSQRTGGKMLPISVGVTTVGFFIIGMSRNLPVLYAGSVLIGVGLSWFLPQTQLMIGASVPQEQCTYAYGVNGAVSNAGQFLSALVLGGCAADGRDIDDDARQHDQVAQAHAQQVQGQGVLSAQRHIQGRGQA